MILKIKINLYEKILMTYNCYDVHSKTTYRKYDIEKIKKSTIEKILKQKNVDYYNEDYSFISKCNYKYMLNDVVVSQEELHNFLKEILLWK